MSIRAKIEAIVYAAEEPVTLAQLAALLGEDAEAGLAAEAQASADAPSGDGEIAVADGETPANEAVAAQSDEVAVAKADDAAVAQGDGAGADGALFADEDARAKRAAKEKDRRVREYLRREAEALIAEYAENERGMEIREVAGGYRMATKPEYHDIVRGFVKGLKPPVRLTLQALETLAVIAYKQPVTAPEISEIRGVDSSGVLGSLISRKLITTAGRKQVIGRPILYKTTKDFLLRFGLKDVAELPSIEEFEKMAGELAEQDALPIVDETASATELEAAGETEPSAETIREELKADLTPEAEPETAVAPEEAPAAVEAEPEKEPEPND